MGKLLCLPSRMKRKIIEERITEGKYSVALPYNVYTVQLRDLKINKDRAGDIYNYVGYLSTKPQYSYINFILREYDEDYLSDIGNIFPGLSIDKGEE